jgi:transglutaminase-like putative cysteine protease
LGFTSRNSAIFELIVHYKISHTTTYSYSLAVRLQPHYFRLRPRSQGNQILQSYQLTVDPEPTRSTDVLDAEGNAISRYHWSDTPTSHLEFRVVSEVATSGANPFDFLLEPWATELPIDYPRSVFFALEPYLRGSPLAGGGHDPVAAQLAAEVVLSSGGNTLGFLTQLNQQIYESCQYQIRDTGPPLPPAITWGTKSGSCRDVAVLFMAACRSVGLASRFVSGYQEGDPDSQDRHLHAWAEVYLPGAGWRGYDPTQGLAVSDRHIALVASAWSRNAAPVSGSVLGKGAESQMNYQLSIQKLDEFESI